MKDVANQLERGGAHKAVWIDAKSHVVNGLATMDGLGNHELLVFGPGKLYGRWRRIRRIARGGLRRFEKTPDHGTKRIHGRRFRVFLVSREHGAKAIGSGKHDFGKIRAMGARNPGRKRVFEFVSEFAEFVEAAGSRITLQGVDHAANPAHHFLVVGASLELQASFVEGLQ